MNQKDKKQKKNAQHKIINPLRLRLDYNLHCLRKNYKPELMIYEGGLIMLLSGAAPHCGFPAAAACPLWIWAACP